MKTRTALIVAVATLAIAGLPETGSAVSVAVTNHSFESPGNGPNSFGGLITGWQDGDQGGTQAGTFHPTATRYPLSSGPTDGVNVAFSNGPFISQVLAELLTANATYTLNVDIGDRNDTPFPSYTVQLRAGGVTLAQTSAPTPPNGGFTTATVNFLAPSGHAQLDTPLEIRLLTGGVQANYDNVRLDTTLLNDGMAIAISNASFEAAGHGDGGNSLGIPGWATTGTSGDFNPTAAQGHPTDGTHVAFSNGGTISQVLSDTLMPNSRYVLTVDLIDRFDTPFPNYQVQLLAGGVLLAEDNSTLNPVSGFLTSKVETVIGASHAQLGQALEIRLISGGIQADFDNVRLTKFDVPIPEPTTAALGLLCMGALAMHRRRPSRAMPC